LRFRREEIDQWLGTTGCSPLARTAGDHDLANVPHDARSNAVRSGNERGLGAPRE
jgi:hypothetical protein